MGPLLNDKDFFDSLSDDLGAVKAAAADGNYKEARRLFASYIRENLDRERFFTIPYETPENIYKLPGESDSEACRRIEDYKVVSVGVLGDFSEKKRIGWFDNPTSNGYREWTWQLSRHNEIKMMAHEYNLTHDEEIARVALDIMRSWIEDAPVPPIGTVGYATECWRTIECGIRMGANWPYILFSFIQSPYFTDDLIVDWFKSIFEHAVRLSHDHMKANWLIMEMNGLAHIGILYPFFRESGVWFEQAVSTLEEELDKQFYKDGFQYELTTNYHDVVINNYQRLFETAKAYDVALPDDLRRKLLKACTLYVKIMMPDGTTPDINDGRRAPVREFLEPKARFFSDDDISFALEGGKEPQYRSVVLPYSGFVVFRSGWGKDDVWGFLDAAPFGRAHQHEDKLSFLLYANGRLLVPEGGIYAYDESEMRKYILSTRSHNTVRVDGCDQDRRRTYKWHDEDIQRPAGIASNIPDDDIEMAEGEYSEGYSGVEDRSVVHKRKVYFLRRERVFVIIDRLTASEEHTYDVLWHVDDRKKGELDYENLKIFVPTPDVEITTVRGRMDGEIQGFIATGQAQGSYREVDCLTVTAKGKDRTVVTVLQPKDEKGKEVLDVRQTEKTLTIRFAGSGYSMDL